MTDQTEATTETMRASYQARIILYGPDGDRAPTIEEFEASLTAYLASVAPTLRASVSAERLDRD